MFNFFMSNTPYHLLQGGGFRWSKPPSLFSKTCDLKKKCNAYLMPIFTNFYLNTIIIPNKYMYLKNHVFKEFCTTNRNLFVMKKKNIDFFLPK